MHERVQEFDVNGQEQTAPRLPAEKLTPWLPANFQMAAMFFDVFATGQAYGNEVNGGDFYFLQTSYWDAEKPHVLRWTTADLAKAEPSKWTRNCLFFSAKDSFAVAAWRETKSMAGDWLAGISVLLSSDQNSGGICNHLLTLFSCYFFTQILLWKPSLTIIRRHKTFHIVSPSGSNFTFAKSVGCPASGKNVGRISYALRPPHPAARWLIGSMSGSRCVP